MHVCLDRSDRVHAVMAASPHLALDDSWLVIRGARLLAPSQSNMVQWNAARTKVQIRLSIQRLRTLQEKKLALAKKSRREIADLLLKGRVETSKLRVEGLIQDDIYVELLELLEVSRAVNGRNINTALAVYEPGD